LAPFKKVNVKYFELHLMQQYEKFIVIAKAYGMAQDQDDLFTQVPRRLVPHLHHFYHLPPGCFPYGWLPLAHVFRDTPLFGDQFPLFPSRS
jgi:hypothetical protein